FYDPGLPPVTRFARHFADSIYLVGASTFGYALLMLFSPVLQRGPASGEERERARGIVEEQGRTNLAPLALLPDKSYFFSPGGSVIPYVHKGRVAVTLGDPIGPEADFAAAVQAFRDHCARNDWLPALYQVQPAGLAAYRR